MIASWKEIYDKPRQRIKKQRHHFASKVLSSQSYGFSSSHVCMWVLDHKESWALKNWCFGTVVLKKALESPFDSEEIKAANPKGNQLCIFKELNMLPEYLQDFVKLPCSILQGAFSLPPSSVPLPTPQPNLSKCQQPFLPILGRERPEQNLCRTLAGPTLGMGKGK